MGRYCFGMFEIKSSHSQFKNHWKVEKKQTIPKSIEGGGRYFKRGSILG